jgi:hypothetical protein
LPYLCWALTYRLAQCLAIPATPDEQEHIFRFDGPLGSFAARIDTAYAFGFIDKSTGSQLSDVREMRNACAHTTKPISFAVPQLANVTRRLFHPNGFTKLGAKANAEEMKHAFVVEFLFIHNVLIHGSREEGHRVMRETWSEVLGSQKP